GRKGRPRPRPPFPRRFLAPARAEGRGGRVAPAPARRGAGREGRGPVLAVLWSAGGGQKARPRAYFDAGGGMRFFWNFIAALALALPAPLAAQTPGQAPTCRGALEGDR